LYAASLGQSGLPICPGGSDGDTVDTLPPTCGGGCQRAWAYPDHSAVVGHCGPQRAAELAGVPYPWMMRWFSSAVLGASGPPGLTGQGTADVQLRAAGELPSTPWRRGGGQHHLAPGAAVAPLSVRKRARSRRGPRLCGDAALRGHARGRHTHSAFTTRTFSRARSDSSDREIGDAAVLSDHRVDLSIFELKTDSTLAWQSAVLPSPTIPGSGAHALLEGVRLCLGRLAPLASGSGRHSWLGSSAMPKSSPRHGGPPMSGPWPPSSTPPVASALSGTACPFMARGACPLLPEAGSDSTTAAAGPP
jgi:hypothetical protein